MPKRVLLIAFHYPPIQGSSGVHRSLAFSKYLPDFGWDVSVLTVHPRAFQFSDNRNLQLIPANTRVLRATAWDAARHLSVFGRYPDFLARPDRWSSWIPFGLAAGKREHRNNSFDAILSTFPIATAHVLANRLTESLRLPWIADFRDPMATPTYPRDPELRQQWKRIQDMTVERSARVIVATEGAINFYRRTYPAVDPDKFVLIENGFDPGIADSADGRFDVIDHVEKRLVLMHSGIIYPRERDPVHFFRALQRYIKEEGLTASEIEIRLRASGYEAEYAGLVAQLGLQGIINFQPALPYSDALHEMQQVDGLLLLQGNSCNDQIPAKAYEYLHAGRPILGLTNEEGDTGRLLRRFGVPGIACLENEEEILRMLKVTIPMIRQRTYPVPSREAVMSLSRRAGTKILAGALDAAIAGD